MQSDNTNLTFMHRISFHVRVSLWREGERHFLGQYFRNGNDSYLPRISWKFQINFTFFYLCVCVCVCCLWPNCKNTVHSAFNIVFWRVMPSSWNLQTIWKDPLILLSALMKDAASFYETLEISTRLHCITTQQKGILLVACLRTPNLSCITFRRTSISNCVWCLSIDSFILLQIQLLKN